MGKRLLYLGFLLGGLFGLSLPPCEAASGDADGTYTVTVTKIELSTDGTNFITVFDGSSAINIASVTAGAQAAGLVSGAAVPPGTYTTVRTTIGANLLIKGYINIGGTTFYTNNDSDGFGSAAGNDNQNQPDYAISTFAVPAANRTSSQSFTITVPKGGPPPTMRVAFDTSGTLINAGGNPSLGPPSITTSSS